MNYGEMIEEYNKKWEDKYFIITSSVFDSIDTIELYKVNKEIIICYFDIELKQIMIAKFKETNENFNAISEFFEIVKEYFKEDIK